MSGRHEREMEDKFAAKAVTFKPETAVYGKQTEFIDHSKNMGLENLSSDVKKEKEEKEAIKQDSYVTRKAKRIFGALGDVKTMFL